MLAGFLKNIPKLCMIAVISTVFVYIPAFAQSGPTHINISGVMLDASGSAILNPSVNFKIELYDKAGTCLLYSENHSAVNLSNTKGGFSLEVGAGTGIQNLIDGSSPTAMSSKVYENNGVVAGGWAGCLTGTTLNNGDERLIRVKYDLGGGFVTMTPDVPLAAAAYAVVAETLQGKRPSDFIQVHNDATNKVTQANVENVFSSTNYPKLTALLGGTSGDYIPSTPTAAVGFNNQRITNVATPTGASDAANKGYVDGFVGGKAVDVTGVGPATGDGFTLVWDQAQQKWVAGAAVATDNTKLPLAGGTMTGAITMGGFDILGTGYITMSPQKTLTLGTFTTAQETTLVGTLTAANKGASWYNSTTNTYKIWDGTTAVAISLSGATAGGDLTGTYPNPTIANDKITSAKVDSAGVGINRLVISDQTTGANLKFATCANNEVLRYEGANGWICRDPSAIVTFPVASVNGKTGVVVLNANDLGLGTAALENVGTAAGNVPQLDAGGKLPSSVIPTLGSNYIVDGGNTRGAAISVGTNDNFALNFRTNNANVMTVLPSGNVGIGMATPTHSLSLGTGSTKVIYNSFTDASNYERAFENWNSNEYQLGLEAAGTGTVRNMRIGTFGSGTFTSTVNLVAGNGATGGTGYINLINNGTTSLALNQFLATLGVDLVTNGKYIYGSTAASGVLRLDSTSNATKGSVLIASGGGNVGIGTTTANSALDVRGVSGDVTSLGIMRFNSNNGTNDVGIKMGAIAGAGSIGYSFIQSLHTSVGNDANLILNPAGSGNVGVGTTSPARLLHVNGPMRITPAALPSSPAAGELAFDSGASNALKYHNGTSWVSLTGGGSGDFMKDGSVAMTGNFNAGGNSILGNTTASATLTLESTSNATKGYVNIQPNGGNVGIGTTTPSYPLHVKATNMAFGAESTNSHGVYGQTSNASSYGVYGWNMTNGAGIYGGSNTGIGGKFASTSGYAIITTAGNVGLGTSTPARQLHVNGAMRIEPAALPVTPAAGDVAIDSGASNALKYHNGSAWVAVGSGSGDFLRNGTLAMTGNFNAGGNSILGNTTASADLLLESTSNATKGAVKIQPNGGYVGIGTTATPASTLQIVDSGQPVLTVGPTTAANGNAIIDLVGKSSGTQHTASIWADWGGGFQFQPAANSQYNFRNNAGSSLMFIEESTGRVGVGTTSPASILDIRGSADGDVGMTIGNSNAGSSAAAVLNVVSDSGTFSMAMDSAAQGSAATLWTTANSNMNLATNNAVRMSISGTGNVGIGTLSPARLLHVNGPVRIAPAALPGTPAAGDLAIDSGASNVLKYHNGSAWVAVGSGSGDFLRNGTLAMTGDFNAGGYRVLGNSTASANLELESTSNATKGYVLLQKNGGNVGIGTSSPSNILSVQKDQNAPTILSVANATNGTAAEAQVFVSNNNGDYLTYGMYATGHTGGTLFQAGGAYTQTSSPWGLAIAATNAGGTLRFGTGGTADANERMRIDSTGNVGIGTTTPTYKLDVNGTIGSAGKPVAVSSGNYTQFFEPAANVALYLGNATDPANYYDNTTHYFRARTGSSTFVTINSSGVSAPAYFYTSDERLKSNIHSIETPLDKVLALRGVDFTWKESGDKDVGFIAQEVEKVVPELVKERKDDKLGTVKTVKYGNIVALVVEAVKEIWNKVLGHDEAIERLTQENAELKQQMLEMQKNQELILQKLNEIQRAPTGN